MTAAESLAKYVAQSQRAAYAVVRCYGPPHFDYDHAHAVGEVVTWSVSKRAARDAVSAQWCPELYHIVKTQRVQ